MERPPGRAVRPWRAQVLHLRAGAVATGCDLPGGAAGDLGAGAVPVHGDRGAAVLRLCLSADGLYRDLHVDRAAGRRRPHRPHPARWRSVEPAQVPSQGDQALPVGADCALDRLYLHRLFRADPRSGRRGAQPVAGAVAVVLDAVLRVRHLGQCGLHARAGVQVHVPVCALPERDGGSRYLCRDLRRRPRRAARQPVAQDRSLQGGAWRLRQLQHLRTGVPDRHRYPRRPAVRVHRLRRLHRRLQPGHGQDGLSARPDPVYLGKRDAQGLVRSGIAQAPAASARHHLFRDLGGAAGRLHGVDRAAHAAEGRHHPRPWCARP